MSDANNAAIEAIVSKFREIAGEYQHWNEKIAAAERDIVQYRENQAAVAQSAQDCYAAARVLNFDLVALAASQAHNHSQPEPITPPQRHEVIGTRQHNVRIKDFVLSAAKRAYPNRVRAVELRQQLEAQGTVTHEKTIGMTLYRLSLADLVRREGRDWFFVPQDEETKNPGVVAPGSTST